MACFLHLNPTGLFLIAYVSKLRNTDIEVDALMGRSDTGGFGYENTRSFKCGCFDHVSAFHSTPPIGDYSSTDVEGGRGSDITTVSHKNVREKYSYTQGEQRSDQLSAQLNVG